MLNEGWILDAVNRKPSTVHRNPCTVHRKPCPVLLPNFFIRLAYPVQKVVHAEHLIHGIIQKELDIGHSTHLFADFTGQSLAQLRMRIIEEQDYFGFVFGAINTDVDFSHQKIWGHFYIGYGDEFASAINIATFFGEYHSEKAADKLAYLFLTNGFHCYAVIK